MAVEIRELVIKAVIAGSEEAGKKTPAPGTTGHSLQTQELIQACVEQVLKILKQEKHR